MPGVAEPGRRLPDRDFAPVVLNAARAALEDPPARPALQDHRQVRPRRRPCGPLATTGRSGRSRRRTRGRPGIPPRRSGGSARSPLAGSARTVLRGDQAKPARPPRPRRARRMPAPPRCPDRGAGRSAGSPRGFSTTSPAPLQQAQVARDRRAADRQHVRDLLDGSFARCRAARRWRGDSGRRGHRTGRPPGSAMLGRSAAGSADGTHPVVLGVVGDLGQPERLQERRHVHAEPTAQTLLQAVPAADAG